MLDEDRRDTLAHLHQLLGGGLADLVVVVAELLDEFSRRRHHVCRWQRLAPRQYGELQRVDPQRGPGDDLEGQGPLAHLPVDLRAVPQLQRHVADAVSAEGRELDVRRLDPHVSEFRDDLDVAVDEMAEQFVFVGQLEAGEIRSGLFVGRKAQFPDQVAPDFQSAAEGELQLEFIRLDESGQAGAVEEQHLVHRVAGVVHREAQQGLVVQGHRPVACADRQSCRGRVYQQVVAGAQPHVRPGEPGPVGAMGRESVGPLADAREGDLQRPAGGQIEVQRFVGRLAADDLSVDQGEPGGLTHARGHPDHAPGRYLERAYDRPQLERLVGDRAVQGPGAVDDHGVGHFHALEVYPGVPAEDAHVDYHLPYRAGQVAQKAVGGKVLHELPVLGLAAALALEVAEDDGLLGRHGEAVVDVDLVAVDLDAGAELGALAGHHVKGHRGVRVARLGDKGEILLAEGASPRAGQRLVDGVVRADVNADRDGNRGRRGVLEDIQPPGQGQLLVDLDAPVDGQPVSAVGAHFDLVAGLVYPAGVIRGLEVRAVDVAVHRPAVGAVGSLVDVAVVLEVPAVSAAVGHDVVAAEADGLGPLDVQGGRACERPGGRTDERACYAEFLGGRCCAKHCRQCQCDSHGLA